MIKRSFCFFCILLLLLSLAGCKGDTEDFDVGADFGDEEIKEPEQEPVHQEQEQQKPTVTPQKDEEKTPAPTDDPPVNPPQQKPVEPTPEKEPQQPPETEPEQQTPDSQEKPKIPNLFSSDNAIADTAVFADGKSGYRKGFYLSNALTVAEGDQITYGPASQAEGVHGFTFSAGKATAAINANNAKEEAAYESGMRIYTFTVPKGVTYLQFNVPPELKDTFMLTKNQVFTTADAETRIDPLSGKKALFVGDSICYGSRDTEKKGAWAGRIAEETGLIATNNGKSGTSLSDTRKDRHGLIHDQLLKSKDQKFDYVVLHGGVNDAWDSIPAGTMSKGFTLNSFDTTTFAGGLERLIYTAITTYGDTAAIGYLINFKAPKCVNGTIADMSDYVVVAKEICEKWGISYFDMYNHEQLTKDLMYHTNIHTTDFIHPNPEGYDILAPYIADYMRTIPPCKEEILQKIL